MRFPGTLSARIVVGFAVLLITSGAFSVSTVVTIDRLNTAIRIIRVGYLQLALASRDLADRQDALRAYLRDDLTDESSLRRVRNRLKILRSNRERMLAEAETLIAHFRDVEGADGQQHLGQAERSLHNIRSDVDATTELYETLALAPPIDRLDRSPSSEVTDVQIEAARSALKKLLLAEGRVKGRTDGLKAHLSDRVKSTSESLEIFSQRVRLLQLLWGVTVLLLGGLVMIWTTVTLRPLRRLRDGAQRIAEGEYADRIDVKGPSDIAGLAREFNAMGQAIQERERELVRTERLATVGKMAAMITHEVRNPLSSIGLNTELLEEELADLPEERAEEARSFIRAITGEVDRLTGITEEYLSFARLPEPKLQEESVDRLVENLVDFERQQLEQRGARLAVALGGDLPQVRIDDAQIRQALLNLLRNAGDAVEEAGGGRVTVQTEHVPERGVVTICVSDDGPGIAPEHLDKLFEPFVSTKKGGTGLGLALSQEIVREHGGAIEVESEERRGSRFTISLPVGTVEGDQAGLE